MAKKHSIFIAYKSEDSRYKDIMLGMDIGAFVRPRSTGTECYDCGSIQDVRDEILNGSDVTLYLIGDYSAERLGQKEQRFIKRELQASLCRAKDGHPNALIGIVLPEAADAVYRGSHICRRCGEPHEKICIDDTTVIREFSMNYRAANCLCSYGYCVLARWEDFIPAPEKYIDEACIRRHGPAAQSITIAPE